MKKLYLKSRTRSNITARNETTIFFLSKCFTFHDRFGNTDHFELAHVSARKVTFYLSRASKLMLVPRKKAHRSFVNASRCLARVKQVREAFATRPDCRYNNSPFLWLWSCYTISYRINWRAHYCGYAPIETHSWSCFLRSLSNDYISKKYYKNLFFVLPYSYLLFFFFLLLLTSTRGIRHVISPSEILYTTSLTKRDVSFACSKIEKPEKRSHSIFFTRYENYLQQTDTTRSVSPFWRTVSR